MPIGHTERGFADFADFTDTYGGRVRVRQSSAAMQSCVWVFLDTQLDITPSADRVKRLYVKGEDVQLLHPRDAKFAQDVGYEPVKASGSAHLDLDQAKKLRDALDEWIRDQETA